MIDLNKKPNMTRQNGLHSALRLTLFAGRLIGVLPLKGLMNTRSDGLRFTLRSPYSLLYISSLMGQVIMFIMSFYWTLHGNISLYSFSRLIFFGTGTISIIILANIGQYWPKLIMKVEAMENKLPPLTNVSIYYTATTLFVLIGSLVDFLIATLYNIKLAKICDSDNIAEIFFNHAPWIFSYTSYTVWKGVLAKIFTLQAKFLWSYNDLLIMVISIYLTEHFKMFNQLFEAALKQGHYSCEEFRTHHLKIIRLVKLINDQIGINIVICFGNNLFWLCTQFFNILNKNQIGRYVSCGITSEDAYKIFHSVERTAYFTYSFSFLVTRTLLVLLLAARVHSASVVPLVLLYDIPRARFNVEVKRFIAQIKSIKVALNGLDFFHVTKSTTLTLLGTIVTYELVLFQFDG